MDKTKQPGIKVDSIMLVESIFHRYPVSPTHIEYNCDFRIEKTITQDFGQVALTAVMKGHNKGTNETVFDLVCKYVGIYSVDKDNPNMGLEEFLDTVAASHLFPYIRDYISAQTMRAGMPVIYLPPTNIMALNPFEPVSQS